MGARPTRYATSAEAGSSRVWCRGLCMTGPDYRGTLFTMFIALLIFVLELAISFPFLLANHLTLALPLLIFMVISVSVTVLSAYLASTTDPGIVPRSTTLPHSIIAFPAVRERVVVFKGRHITLKFCDTCRIWRPPRTSHCATCNNCVRRFDHHCPWLGNDIGLRNYRSYFTFVSFASMAELTAIAVSVLAIYFRVEQLLQDDPALARAAAIRRTLAGAMSVNLVLILLCFLAFLFTGGLTGFHLYLMSQNVTTSESFKKRRRNAAYSHDEYRGFRACFHLQCTRRQPSAVTDGYLGPSYPEEDEFLALIDAQVRDEKGIAAHAAVPRTATIAPDPPHPLATVPISESV